MLLVSRLDSFYLLCSSEEDGYRLERVCAADTAIRSISGFDTTHLLLERYNGMSWGGGGVTYRCAEALYDQAERVAVPMWNLRPPSIRRQIAILRGQPSIGRSPPFCKF